MKKHYVISYEIVGNRRIDTVGFMAKNIADAVEQFTNWEQNTNGFKWTYNEDAIVRIENK